jgi:hypothetical protein
VYEGVDGVVLPSVTTVEDCAEDARLISDVVREWLDEEWTPLEVRKAFFWVCSHATVPSSYELTLSNNIPGAQRVGHCSIQGRLLSQCFLVARVQTYQNALSIPVFALL